MPPRGEVDPGLRTAEFGLAGAAVVGALLVPSANAMANDTSSAEVEKQALAAFGANAITRSIDSFPAPAVKASNSSDATLVPGPNGLVSADVSPDATASGSSAGHHPLVIVQCMDKTPSAVPHPRSCDFRVPQFDSYKVSDMHWKHWGGRRTSTTGIYTYAGERVRIVLSQLETCQVGPPYAVKAYTHMVLDTKKFEPWSFPIPDCDLLP